MGTTIQAPVEYKIATNIPKGLGDLIEGMANYFGVGNALSEILGGKNPSIADLSAAIDEIVTEASTKADINLDQLQSRILNLPIGKSPLLRTAVANAKKRIDKLINKAQLARAEGQVLADKARNLASDIAGSSLGDKWQGTSEEKERQMKELAQQAADKFKDSYSMASTKANNTENNDLRSDINV